jgi:LuxR family maltose regulon positive regulatory protein
MERLNQGMAYPLTLISAPAGSGKSTLLGEWLGQSAWPAAWLSLDEGDNDLVRFLNYLIAALQTIQPLSGEASLAALRSPQARPVESALRPLMNEMATAPDDFVLVLDDYHVIDAAPVHHAITFLLDHLPPPMHVMIASRVDPPLPLARLRARAQLVELRAADLRFLPDEAAAFLNAIMGLGLPADEVAILEERTEGWIAGLQLAALSLREQEDAARFLQTFTGSHRYIADYLAEEVLRHQSDNVQAFLLQTAILDRLTGSLCDAVTGRDDGQVMLEYLEASNLFTLPLDLERRWYRYHHLFADVLRNRLRQTQPDLVPELHRRASQWYERNGLMTDAVSHALAAQDFERAGELIERIARTLWIRRELTTLLGWLEALPANMVCSRPRLAVSYAWALFAMGQWDRVEAQLQCAERALGTQATSAPDELPGETRGMVGEMAAIRAAVACNRGQIAEAIELSRQALERLPEDDLILRGAVAGMIALNLGNADNSGGEVVAASQVYARAAAMSRAAGDMHAVLFAASKLAQLQAIQGQLRQAASTYREALRLADGRDEYTLPAAGMAHIGLGELLREWNDLEGAKQHLEQGMELGQRGGDTATLSSGYMCLARVFQAQGEKAQAFDMIQQAVQFARASNVTWSMALAAACRAQLWLTQGNLRATIRWAEDSGLAVGDAIGYLREREYITWARVLISQNRHHEAVRLLAWLLGVIEKAALTGSVIEALVVQALAFDAQGDASQAYVALERALLLAEPEGYIRVFVDEGALMAALLRQAASRGIALDYVGRLLKTLEESASDLAQSAPLVDPLSERELEVLRLVAVGLSNQAIAEALVLSPGTVKAHIHNIHTKLGVSNRTQAVARARELDLLA